MSKSPDTPATFRQPIWTLPKGRILLRALRDDPAQEYITYLPAAHRPKPRVVVSVHGLSRNALEQANAFAPLCEKIGAVLLVPVFTNDGHPDYQRLGRANRGRRVDRALDRCLEEVAALSGADVSQFYLHGYSGGAQFSHRYAMAHPHRILTAFVTAAGWYTFPDTRQKYPYGIRYNRQLRDVHFNPERFLHVPMHVLVGQQDTGMANVRRTPRVNAQQGTTRVERARNWVKAMNASAESFGLPHSVTLHEVPGVDHSFKSFFSRGELVDRVARIIRDTEQAPLGSVRSV